MAKTKQRGSYPSWASVYGWARASRVCTSVRSLSQLYAKAFTWSQAWLHDTLCFCCIHGEEEAPRCSLLSLLVPQAKPLAKSVLGRALASNPQCTQEQAEYRTLAECFKLNGTQLPRPSHSLPESSCCLNPSNLVRGPRVARHRQDFV